MEKFKYLISSFLLCWIINSATVKAQEIVNYSGQFKLDNSKKAITGQVHIEFKYLKRRDSIYLYLNNTAKIKAINVNGNVLKYTREKSEGFLEDVDLFLIPTNQLKQEEKSIEIEYSYSLDSIKHPNFVYRQDWIELSLYTGWYPFNLDSKSFSYHINFDLPKEFRLYSKNVDYKEDRRWKLENDGENKDIVAIISNKANTITSKDGSVKVHSIGFNKVQVRRIQKMIRKMLEFYTSKFGQLRDKPKLTILVNSFNYPMSYARKNIISISTDKRFKLNDELVLAHEIGHLWWNNANYGSFEEWLNESFAELSLLMWVNYKYGQKETEEKLVNYAIKSQNTLSILQANPNQKDWYRIAYLKGSLILWKFKDKIGNKSFFRLCQNINNNRISKTLGLLKQVRKGVGIENRDWLFMQISESSKIDSDTNIKN